MKVKAALEQQSIYPRRYFYPSLNNLPYVAKVNCAVTDALASSVLCLPLYHDMVMDDVERIIFIILENL